MSDDVRRAFAPVAANYLTSSFHAGSHWLDEVTELALPRPQDQSQNPTLDRVLDVATGTGNTALALAPHVAHVTGLDITPEMLAKARQQAVERGIENVDWVLGDAHELPFADASFDLWVARAAPHHFERLHRALAEAHRVLRPGGRLVIIDGSGPKEARDHLHQVELTRDPSHHLMYTLEEWLSLLKEADFEIETARLREMDQDFEPWLTRIGFPAARVAELAAVVEESQGAARAQLRPERREGKLHHAYWHALIRATKPVGTSP